MLYFPVVLKLQRALNSPGGLCRTGCWVHPQHFWFSGWSGGLIICISNKLPGNADASDRGAHSEDCWLWLPMRHLRFTKALYAIVVPVVYGEAEAPRAHPESQTYYLHPRLLDQSSCFDHRAYCLLRFPPGFNFLCVCLVYKQQNPDIQNQTTALQKTPRKTWACAAFACGVNRLRTQEPSQEGKG